MFTPHQFRAFDTDILLGVVSVKPIREVLKTLESDAKDFENEFSRFRESSGLNRINRANGKPVKISEKMMDVLTHAKVAYEKTDGLFDPTVLGSLTGIGYDRSFGSVQNNPESDSNLEAIQSVFRKRVGFGRLGIDRVHGTVQAPAGFGMDLGGIAKGYWVDKTAEILGNISESFWISAGGDVFAKGLREDGRPWRMSVQNPLALEADLMAFDVSPEGLGVATSGITKRTITGGGRSWHHLIDPRTGLPVENSVLSVTAVAPAAMEADVMAKTLLILGIEKGIRKAHKIPGFGCIMVDRDLRIHLSEGIKKHL